MGLRIARANVNPANHGAVASINTDVAIADVHRGQLVIGFPPIAIEAGIVPQVCEVVADGNVRVRTTNASAGAIDPAAGEWSFLIVDES